MSNKNIFEARLDAANQRGVALVMVLLAVLVLSTLPAAVVRTTGELSVVQPAIHSTPLSSE